MGVTPKRINADLLKL